jgi:SAM-dependent methyltransferase
MSVLAPDRLARTYDRIGRFQDWQAFYERPATERLIAHADFEEASSVSELGCGTGAFAAALLERHLPANCRYVGIDISRRMVEIATERLRPWAERAEVQVSDGSEAFPQPTDSADRFVANYVFDLLSAERSAAVVSEAARILVPGGLLCLVSLTHGQRPFTRLVSRAWRRGWSRWPAVVGGCRPTELIPQLPRGEWTTEHRSVLNAWGISSEVVVSRLSKR